jgi:hypothetical protein
METGAGTQKLPAISSLQKDQVNPAVIDMKSIPQRSAINQM